MADNALTGTGVAVATDTVTYSGDANQNVQLVRPVLVTGAEGSKTVVDLTGDATNGLDIDVTRLPALVAGTANIGDVDVLTAPPIVIGNTMVTSTVTPTIDTSAYASGDNLATAVMTFTGIARANGGTARIIGMTILDKTTPSGVNNPAPLELWLMDTTFTPAGAANAAWSISDTIAATVVAIIPCGPYSNVSTSAVSIRQGISYPVKCAGATTSLFGAVVVRGTPTYGGTTDLVITLSVAQDP